MKGYAIIMFYRRLAPAVVAIAMILSLTTPAFAAQRGAKDYAFAPSGVAREKVAELSDSNMTDIQPRGTSAPSTNWDLSSHNYTIQFTTSVAIFSNVNFSKHNGEFYIDIDCTSDEDQTMYVQLYEKGSSKVATEVIIDTDGAWNIHFYNLDTSKAYYLRFVKIDDGVSVYGYGTVHL